MPFTHPLPVPVAVPVPDPLAFPVPIDLREAFETQPPPLDFVLPGMLAGTIGALVSPGGVGKSFLALEWAVLIGAGVDLLGLDLAVPTGRVVLMCAEDPPDALEHRLYALGKHLDPAARGRIQENVVVLPLIGCSVDLMDDRWLGLFLQQARDTRLMVIDTLRRVHVADENDGGQMARLLGRMEQIAAQTGCSIVYLHHTTKSAALNGQGDVQQASRGSSVLTDNIRWQSFLGGMSKEEAKKFRIAERDRGRCVRFGIPKRNYGAPMPDLWLRRAEGGVLVPAKLEEKRVAATTGRPDGGEKSTSGEEW